MSSETPNAFRRFVLLVVIVALIGSPALTGTLAEPARAQPRFGCGETGLAPSQLSMHVLRSSVLCLVNRVRKHYGLKSLHFNLDLRMSASRHSADMVTHDYFAHDGLYGGTLGDRVGRSGYLHRVSSYFIGENIGGGTGRRFGSPAAVYRAWMDSSPHRANILNADFRDVGVGVARGFPGNGDHGAATYTLDFGTRH